MNLGIGASKTREDHKQVSDQMYANYAEGVDLRGLVAIVGEEEMRVKDKKLLKFAQEFEDKFVRQGKQENRSINKTLDIGWDLFTMFEKRELTRISPELRDRYFKGKE